ncbi:restriction endonuclease subunit S [Pseudobacillus badius]|uniref:restriction endonuclease subunit S n=1 Tax=Bacillus badius TaxID=1455 RepID=UPI0007B3D6C0|nr:restriction endonuclease subunit S [Bacillus badius]KZR59972.1 hypothetical protein A3781_10890 [Bacillus badius]
MSKKKKTIEELLEEAVVPEEEQPYEVPTNWVWVKLGTVTKFINGDRGKNYPSQKEFIESGIPFVNAGHIQNGNINMSKMNYISNEKYNSLGSGKIVKNDILYCLRGTLGKTAIVREIEKGAIASSLVILRPHIHIINSYLYFYLISHLGMSMISLHDNGSAQPNLSANNVKKYVFPLPPFNEQKRIAEKVECLLRKIEDAKQLIEEAKETFELRYKSILKKALNGELTKKWRESESDSISAYEHIQNAYNELKQNYEEKCLNAKIEKKPKPKRPEIFKHFSLKDNSVDGLSKWVKTTFIHLCVLQRGFDLPVQNRIDGNYPIVSAGGIIDSHNEFKVKGAGVTTGRSGTIGSVFYIEENYWPLNTSLYVDYFNGNNPKYVYYYLLNFDFKTYSSSTAVPTLNRNNFFDVEVKIPPKKEQDIIVEILDEFFDKETESFKFIEQLGGNLETLKQSILSKAFRGELGTNDPSEGNAIELLKDVLQEQVK